MVIWSSTMKPIGDWQAVYFGKMYTFPDELEDEN